MDKNERFVYDEVDDGTPKQSPQSSQTWPMDKIRQSRFQQKMSSLLSPVTPKRNYSISNAKSLLMQCLRDSKSDPLPRRRFPVSCSDEGILMDGVLVTSATTGKKMSSSLGRSAGSSIFQNQHKNIEFSSPRSKSGRNLQETTGSQQSSSPCTRKAANPSKLQASAEPFTLTPRSPPRQASPFPPQQLPYDHYNPLFPWDHPLHLQPCPYLHRPRPPFYVYQNPPPLPVLPHGSELYQLGPTGYLKNQTPIINEPYQLDCGTIFPSLTGNPTPTRNNDTRISLLPTTPPSSHPSTNTREPPVHTPLSTPAANLSTSSTTTTTTHGSSPTVDGLDAVTEKLDLSDELKTMTQEPSSPSDGLDTVTQIPDSSSPSEGLDAVTQKPDLPSPSDELDTVTQEPDLSSSPSDELQTVTHEPYLSSPSDGLETVTQEPDLSSPSDELQTVTQNPDLSPSVGLQTMTTGTDWSPSDDKLPTLTQEEHEFMKSQGRVLPDSAFELYKFRGGRMSCFRHLCSEEDQ